MNCETLEKENNKLKQDLKAIDEIYIKLVQQLAATEVEKENLEEQLEAIEEDGTEEHNAAFDLRCKLAEALVEKDQWKEVAKKLYSVVLQLQEVSKTHMVVVVGPNFYSETVEAIKAYEKYESNS
jgi:chromosome segregation ATPase